MKREGIVYHNGYYRFSTILKYIRYGVLLALAVFTLIIFAAFRQDMTLNHFRYLLNNFDFSPNAHDTSGDILYYDADADATFGFVSGGFVTLTDTRVFVTDRSSSTTLSAYHGYRQPMGVYSETYMLIYDRKGSTATVYNAFSLLKTLTFDSTILTAACADNGNFAVAVADSDGYYTKVHVYDKDFREIRTLSKYKYVTSLAFAEGGNSLLVGSRYTDGGKTGYEIQLLPVDSTTPTFTLSLDTPVYALMAHGDGIHALTETGVVSYSLAGERIWVRHFSTLPHKSLLLDSGAIAVTADADGRQETLSYYRDGETLTYPSDARFVTAEEDETYLYFLLEGKLLVLDKKTGAWHDVTDESLLEGALMLVRDEERVYLARAHRADRLDGGTLVDKTLKNTAS